MLLLPAGNIEPDPVSRDAIASLESWSPSIGLMVRRVPHLYVVPAAVSGVLLSSYQRHPMTWIRRSAADRRQLAATLQVLARASSATVRLAYGPPLTSKALIAARRDARAATAVVVEHTRMLMQQLSPNSHSGGMAVPGGVADWLWADTNTWVA